MRYLTLLIGVVAATLVGCSSGSEPPVQEPLAEGEPAMPSPEPPPAMIVAERGGFSPEGVEYDAANGRFLIGSMAEGTIFQLHDDGRVTEVVSDPDLIASVGIEVDEPRSRLLVANMDPAALQGEGAGQAKLGVYDLSTGERMAMVDLAATVADPPGDATYAANDVAVAADGTVYVTDTLFGVLYRIDTDYNASVFHRFDDFAPNGIIVHEAGYLLTGGGDVLWKVPLQDPEGASQVAVPEGVTGMDGMVWRSDGSLAIVSWSESRVMALTSDDNWATAELAEVAPVEHQVTAGAEVTTAAIVGDHVYAIHPHMRDQDPPSLERLVFQ